MRAAAVVVGLVASGLASAHADPQVGRKQLASGTIETILPVSTSCGFPNRGALAFGARLPTTGRGYTLVEPWRSRDHRYGTAELVNLIQRVAATVDRAHPGAVLSVGDLSRPGGGAVTGHRSHQSGRDVDLIYYAVDEAKRPFPPDSNMPYYTRTGLAWYSRHPTFNKKMPPRFFDVARNWTLIKALISDPSIQVEQLFVSNRVERWVLEHAKKRGEPAALVHKAMATMRRPPRGESHNDHIHLRIACSARDRERGGCRAGVYPARRSGPWRVQLLCPAKGPFAPSR